MNPTKAESVLAPDVALSIERDKFKGMLAEALVEWAAWAADCGCDLETDPGPDGQKYRKFKGSL